MHRPRQTTAALPKGVKAPGQVPAGERGVALASPQGRQAALSGGVRAWCLVCLVCGCGPHCVRSQDTPSPASPLPANDNRLPEARLGS